MYLAKAVWRFRFLPVLRQRKSGIDRHSADIGGTMGKGFQGRKSDVSLFVAKGSLHKIPPCGTRGGSSTPLELFLVPNFFTMATKASRIVLGDCLTAMRTLPDRSVDFVCSDFPYNISGKGGLTINSKKGVVPADFGEWDKWETEEDYFDFVFRVCREYKRILKPNASLVLFFSYYTGGWIAHELHRRKVFTFKSPLVLAKENPLPNIRERGFRACFEFAVWLLNNRETGSYRPRSFHFLSQAEMKNVMSYKIGPGYKKSCHPTEKPEHLIGHLVRIFTNPGDLVLDSFAGGGTTAVACQQSNRRFIAIEKLPKYYEMMKRRLINGLPQAA